VVTADPRPPGRYFIAGTAFDAPPLAPGLYVVSTPIGNLRDITIRALETLAGADVVYCEDTRTSARLLDHYGIKSPRKALHEHNERQKAEAVVADLGRGAAIALISDAGTPLLSDPGFPLVRAVREAGLPVFAVPGASALLAGLAVAGLPTDSFAYIGFLPATLGAMAEGFGAGREAAVALELTKRFERVSRGSLEALVAQYGGQETKGEAVILVAGADADAVPDIADWQAALDLELVEQPLRAAVDAITLRFGLKRRDVYNAALTRKTQE
jgi:16S rRNA (cytidine1402-2'-O)-methyltransferase